VRRRALRPPHTVPAGAGLCICRDRWAVARTFRDRWVAGRTCLARWRAGPIFPVRWAVGRTCLNRPAHMCRVAARTHRHKPAMLAWPMTAWPMTAWPMTAGLANARACRGNRAVTPGTREVRRPAIQFPSLPARSLAMR
jgi:hypothetical protein